MSDFKPPDTDEEDGNMRRKLLWAGGIVGGIGVALDLNGIDGADYAFALAIVILLVMLAAEVRHMYRTRRSDE